MPNFLLGLVQTYGLWLFDDIKNSLVWQCTCLRPGPKINLITQGSLQGGLVLFPFPFHVCLFPRIERRLVGTARKSGREGPAQSQPDGLWVYSLALVSLQNIDIFLVLSNTNIRRKSRTALLKDSKSLKTTTIFFKKKLVQNIWLGRLSAFAAVLQLCRPHPHPTMRDGGQEKAMGCERSGREMTWYVEWSRGKKPLPPPDTYRGCSSYKMERERETKLETPPIFAVVRVCNRKGTTTTTLSTSTTHTHRSTRKRKSRKAFPAPDQGSQGIYQLYFN